jgi:DNA-binding MarR family transcriptional regulator
MKKEPTAQRIYADFGRMIASIVLHNDSVAQQTGLSPRDAQSLHLAQLHPELTPGELGRRTGLPSGTVTGVIDRLERAGFVRRERSAEDRRKVFIQVDQHKVDQVFGPLYAGQAARLRRAVEDLSPREQAAVAKFLTALTSE